MKPRKPGRPPIDPDEQQCIKLTVMVRPREAKAVNVACRKKGVTVSALLRQVLAPYIEAAR